MNYLNLSQSRAASGNLKLAEKYYNTRFVELRGLILAEEVKFKYVPILEHICVSQIIILQDHFVRN
jgi:hypothetical protein